jgi:hypothetical protein
LFLVPFLILVRPNVESNKKQGSRMFLMSRPLVAALAALTIGACVHDWDKYDPVAADPFPFGGAGGAAGATASTTGGMGGAGGGALPPCIETQSAELRCASLCATYEACIRPSPGCQRQCMQWLPTCRDFEDTIVCECVDSAQSDCAGAAASWNLCMDSTACYEPP